MKKLFLICLSLMCFATVYAEGEKTCNVSGGSVVVSTLDDDGEVKVMFSNDSDKHVNVTATISLGAAGERQITMMVPPYSQVHAATFKGRSSKVVKVSGTKCN